MQIRASASFSKDTTVSRQERTLRKGAQRSFASRISGRGWNSSQQKCEWQSTRKGPRAMFDAQTVELISSAPALDGLDLETLSKDLTRAYSTIVSVRMRLREMLTAETFESELGDIVRRLET